MRHDIFIARSRQAKTADTAQARPAFGRSAPGQVNVRLWVTLVWVVVMLGVLWWGIKRNPSVAVEVPAQPDAKVAQPGNLTLGMVWIGPGNFLMGSPTSEAGRYPDEGPQTRVTLTKGFWLGKNEVTQGEWQTIMGKNPSQFTRAGLDAPVENVSWDEAMAFCQKLTEQERAAGRLPTGYHYTLPTEAQWEYACRAGTTGPFAADLDSIAWYAKNSGNTTHPVGTKQPNPWGLYDMQGNVWQWCLDWYGSYPGGSVTDPTGPVSGPEHVFRGGCWSFAATDCRSASRDYDPGYRDGHLGLRLALSPVP